MKHLPKKPGLKCAVAILLADAAMFAAIVVLAAYILNGFIL